MTHQRRVVFVASVGSTLSHFVEPLAREAARQGWQTVACGEGASACTGFDRVHELPPFRRRGVFAHARCARALGRILREEKPDVVHLHTPSALFLGRVVAARHRIPSVAVVHGSFLDDRSWRRVVFALAELATARMASLTVVVNDMDAAFYKRLCRPGSVAIAPVGGIGLDPWIEQVVEHAGSVGMVGLGGEADGHPHAPPSILYLGRLAADKNLDQLVRAWIRAREEIPDIRLRIVGAPAAGDPVWTPPDLDGIDLLPWTDDPTSEQFRATVAVSTSRREGFPMFVAESLACGTPVVAVANRGSTMIAQRAAGLRVVADEAEEIACAIVAAIRSAGPRRVRHDLLQQWSRSNACSFHLSILTRLASGATPRDQLLQSSGVPESEPAQPRPAMT